MKVALFFISAVFTKLLANSNEASKSIQDLNNFILEGISRLQVNAYGHEGIDSQIEKTLDSLFGRVETFLKANRIEDGPENNQLIAAFDTLKQDLLSDVWMYHRHAFLVLKRMKLNEIRNEVTLFVTEIMGQMDGMDKRKIFKGKSRPHFMEIYKVLTRILVDDTDPDFVMKKLGQIVTQFNTVLEIEDSRKEFNAQIMKGIMNVTIGICVITICTLMAKLS